MHYLPALFSALVLTNVLLNPGVAVHARSLAPASQGVSPLAAVASPDTIGLDKIKDSVLRIGVELGGTLNVPPWKFDPATNTFVASDNPNDGTSESVVAYRLGTGFVVDASGYLITNAHVVDTSTGAITDDLWNEYSQEVWIQIARKYPNLTTEEVTNASDAVLDYVGRNGTWNNLTYNPVVFNPAKTDATGDISELMKDGWSAEIKKMGSPYPQIGNDVAVIKVQSEQVFMPLTLGASSGLVAGSRVYVIGYPTIADLSDKSFLVPTVTSGVVSAIKPSDLGDYKVIQVDANITGGNSGGPILDAQGYVVGIATFGATENDGYNWALPIELAKEYLRELNITPKMAVDGSSVTGLVNKVPATGWAVIAGILLLITCSLLFIVYRHKKHLVQSSVPMPPTSPHGS